MSSSVGVTYPLATKLPELPSSTGSSTVFLPTQVNQHPSGVAISSKSLSLTGKDEVHRICYPVKSLIELLRDSAEKGYLEKAKSIHGLVLKSRFTGKTLTVMLNHLVNAYSKCSDFASAGQLFDEIPHKNVFSWTVLIVGATENGFYRDSFDYFAEMLDYDVFPDEFSLSAAVQACIGLDSVDSGEMVHAQIIIRGFSSLSFVSTCLLNMYAKVGRLSESCRVFYSMASPNVISWNAMIAGFVSNGLFLEAYHSFLKMRDEGIMPNISTIISVSNAIGQLGDIGKGREIELIAFEMDMRSNIHVGTALINMFAKCGCLDGARSVFESNYCECEVNLPWNAMISGYSMSGNSEKAVLLFMKMCRKGVEPDIFTYCSVLNSVADTRSLELGKQVHVMILKSGQDLIEVSLCNALMDVYAKCGELESMRKVFDRLEDRNLISWTTLVTAYSQSCEWGEALSIFSRMREIGFQLNQISLSSVLVPCSSLCFLEYGQQVHSLSYKTGYSGDKSVDSALIDMYAKCGRISDAQKVFKFSSDPDVISWTAMIWGYAQHGMAKDALKLFRQMEFVIPKPNSITLLCVLFACSHGGLVQEGLQYFQLMEEKYGLTPEMEHYACVVDLLGRVGHLAEACEFISKMPIEPDEKVWLTLLGACRVHRDIQLAEIAAQKVLSCNPESSAALILLANAYREAGNIENEKLVRNTMNCQAMRKEPGFSWISVGGKIHKFYSGDQCHILKGDIYRTVNELMGKMKSRSEE
ncbi:PREDICTED: pentatricopeptide repeat-containing protein DOT4, chloroplastic-like [Tarenaya hassleriana]|uniref:pentatricopeptide repeat-containing protein DOT4, chloroplastic-like n=1 Tax=Tarenaya hassleriana TaxID=28532 RepID=UPI00053C2CD6|nr:PREDICTED: pentatricopeptide repeat-containing protein DOT4, chloroplastic-like [Tarenaya hassleriana]